jgi:hypothetical protein
MRHGVHNFFLRAPGRAGGKQAKELLGRTTSFFGGGKQAKELLGWIASSKLNYTEY